MNRGIALYFAIGLVSVVLAFMSVVDLFVPKPYDGITPGSSDGDGIAVANVAAGSGADVAGIAPGDRILGLGEQIVGTPAQAAAELIRHPVGKPLRYLVRHEGRVAPVTVVPGAILLGNKFYGYEAILGSLFFLIGLFVLVQRPGEEVARVFFLLCDLFLLFLVCSLRPSSYYWIDYFVESAGRVALTLLPAVFLHFFLIFPERKVFAFLGEEEIDGEPPSPLRLFLDRWVNRSRALFVVIYLLPPLAFLTHLFVRPGAARTFSGAPTVSWVLLGNYLVLGILALAHSWIRATTERKRRQILPVLLGTLLGTAPFVLLGVVLPSFSENDRLIFIGTIPLVLIPLTFGYAIVRYQLLNVRLVIRKGLLYAVTTAVVTAIYAAAIAATNVALSTASFGGRSTLAFVLAIVVVLFFDPLRRRIQAPVDRLFFRDRVDFARAVREMSEEIRGELSLDRIKAILTHRVTEVTRAGGACLYLLAEGGRDLVSTREAGADEATPNEAPPLPEGGALAPRLARNAVPESLPALAEAARTPEDRAFLAWANDAEFRLAVPLVYQERLLGTILLKAKLSDEDFNREEIEVLATLANQAAVALETSRLHREMTRQAELARDLEIARGIQAGLFPKTLPSPPGIELHAESIPARVVGGDFYDVLPLDGPRGAGGERRLGLLLGDVSGKSIPAALLMVASREIIYAAAIGGADPATVFREANRRIYSIKRRMFVALGYYVLDPAALTLSYAVAGMPMPIVCRAASHRPLSIAVPDHRIPLGALRDVPYDSQRLALAPGDLVLFYSDGLTESMDPSGEPFGEARLERLLCRLRDRSLPEIGASLVDEVRRFSGSGEPYDDMTFLLLRVAPDTAR